MILNKHLSSQLPRASSLSKAPTPHLPPSSLSPFNLTSNTKPHSLSRHYSPHYRPHSVHPDNRVQSVGSQRHAFERRRAIVAHARRQRGIATGVDTGIAACECDVRVA